MLFFSFVNTKYFHDCVDNACLFKPTAIMEDCCFCCQTLAAHFSYIVVINQSYVLPADKSLKLWQLTQLDAK